MVVALAREHGVRCERVLRALLEVPRHLFVDEALWPRAYADDALPIGHGQTISKPSTVARMTEALGPGPEDRVLEVGTGSGYQAAVLGRLAGRVYTVERIAALAVRARGVLNRVGAVHVVVRPGDGALGWPGEGPFHGILVAAAADRPPRPLLEQLVVGGRLVIPVAGAGGQELRRVVREGEDAWREEVLEACRFVPLVSGAGQGTR